MHLAPPPPRRRDEAIQVASEQFALRKGELRGLKAQLDEQARFLQQYQVETVHACHELMGRLQASRPHA